MFCKISMIECAYFSLSCMYYDVFCKENNIKKSLESITYALIFLCNLLKIK